MLAPVHPVCAHFCNILILLYKEEPMDKLPGAWFGLPMHPECAQNETLISNTASMWGKENHISLLDTFPIELQKEKGKVLIKKKIGLHTF